MNVNMVSKVKSTSKQDEVGTSSSNTKMTWKSTCRRSLRSWIGSKSSQVAAVAHSSQSATGLKKSATGLKSVEQSSSNAAKKTAVPKKPPLSKSKKGVEKSQDSSVAAQKKEIHLNEGSKDSKLASKRPEITQKTVISKVPEMDLLYSDTPVYHIRLEDGGEEHKQSGEKCILCNIDLSCSPNGVDHRSRVDDDEKYRVKFIPQMLPAVDFLPCGHAIHTECSKYAMSAESNVPRCVFCLSMPC